MQKLYFVTSNENKVKEAQQILSIPLEISKNSIDEIQSLSIEDIVKKKAEDAFSMIQKPLFVEDAGLYIEAWNGFPGPLIKHIYTAGDNELLLYMLRYEKNRNILLKAAIGFHDGKAVHTFIGELKGTMTMEKKGVNGWGLDPIIIPQGYTETFSQLGPKIKNSISHRYFALQKFNKFLETKTN